MATQVKYYHKNSDIVAFEKLTDSDGYSAETTYNDKGNELTYKNSEGSSSEITYNDKGSQLTYKDSNGYSSERTYDDKGNELTFKDSKGCYAIKGEEVTKEEFENFVNRPCVGKKVIIDGIEYQLK